MISTTIAILLGLLAVILLILELRSSRKLQRNEIEFQRVAFEREQNELAKIHSEVQELELYNTNLKQELKKQQDINRVLHENLAFQFSYSNPNIRIYHFLFIRLYVNTFDQIQAQKLINSTNEFISECGFEIVENYATEKGSFIKRWIAKSKKPETKTEIKKRLEKLEQYFENETLRKSHIALGKEGAEAVSNLLKALPKNADAMIDLGTTILIQKIDDDGRPQIVVRQLTPEEQRYLENHAHLKKDPTILLNTLSTYNPNSKQVINTDNKEDSINNQLTKED